MDPISRRSFWDLIYTFTARGTTVFVTTHYMEEAEYCDRLALMNRARLIALDTPAGLRGSMRAPLLEVRAADSATAVEILKGQPWVIEVGMFGRAVHVVVRDAEEARAAIPGLLAVRGAMDVRIEAIEPSLEDVFVSLVRLGGGAVDG